MKFILVIAGVLAVLAIVQSRPQEAENDNQEEAIKVPSESENLEKPHGRPHFHHPGQQQQYSHPPKESRPEPKPEQNQNQGNSVIEEAEPVFFNGDVFQILNNSRNDNTFLQKINY